MLQTTSEKDQYHRKIRKRFLARSQLKSSHWTRWETNFKWNFGIIFGSVTIPKQTYKKGSLGKNHFLMGYKYWWKVEKYCRNIVNNWFI